MTTRWGDIGGAPVGIHFEHRCDTCGIEFRTDGFMDFYRDAEGAIRLAGHPVPCAEALELGVAGTCCRGWCRNCRKVVLAVESELGQAAEPGPSVWAELGWAERRQPTCPECGGTDLVVGEAATCPECGGRIEVVDEAAS